MWQLLEALKESGFSMFVAESGVAYTTVLALHGLGLALLGMSAAIALRILGVARDLPLAPLASFFRLIWIGFWVNAASGVVLLILDPTKFLVMPDFYIKLIAIALAVATLRVIQVNVFGDGADLSTNAVSTKGKALAGALLAFWFVALVAGRVTAYAGYVQWQTALAVLIVGAVMLVAKLVASNRPSRARSAIN